MPVARMADRRREGRWLVAEREVKGLQTGLK
jgi:hypothetical protein